MSVQKIKLFLAMICLPLAGIFLVGMLKKIKSEFSVMTREDGFYAVFILGFIIFSIIISFFELYRISEFNNEIRVSLT